MEGGNTLWSNIHRNFQVIYLSNRIFEASYLQNHCPPFAIFQCTPGAIQLPVQHYLWCKIKCVEKIYITVMYNYSRVRNETTCIYIFHSLCSEGLLSALRHGSTSSLPTEFGALSPAINCGLGSTGTQSPNVCCARNVQYKKK